MKAKLLLLTGSSAVLAIRYNWNGNSLITVHNFSNKPQQIELDIKDDVPGLYDLLNRSTVSV